MTKLAGSVCPAGSPIHEIAWLAKSKMMACGANRWAAWGATRLLGQHSLKIKFASIFVQRSVHPDSISQRLSRLVGRRHRHRKQGGVVKHISVCCAALRAANITLEIFLAFDLLAMYSIYGAGIRSIRLKARRRLCRPWELHKQRCIHNEHTGVRDDAPKQPRLEQFDAGHYA